MLVFCMVAPCRLVGRYQRTVALKMEAVCSPNHWYLPTSSYDVTTHKINIDIFTAVKISSLNIWG
jgi:hypothetical protein